MACRIALTPHRSHDCAPIFSLKKPWLSKVTSSSVLCAAWMLFGFATNQAQAQVRPLLGPVFIPPAIDSVDPVPIRRVFVPLERVSAELERAGAKKLVYLSQADFSARLRAARKAQIAALERPRLLEARFRANLVGSALVGSAEWRLSHVGSSPGVFPMRPLSLALRQATLDGEPAILGDIEPRSLGLLVEKPGAHRLNLDWSVRGESSPNGIRFDVRVPNCVLTAFELDLPTGRLLSEQSEQCLVTGPFATASAKSQRWVVEVLNRSRVVLLVRTPDRQDRGAPLVAASVEQRQNLSLEQVECIHDFTIEASRGAVRELDLACAPGLQPLSVAWRNADLEDWQLLPAAAGQNERRLHIRLPEALQGGPASLRIRAVAPGPLHQLWHSPELRLYSAVLLSEKLTIQIAPQLELADWNPGSFELTKTLTDPLGSFLLELQARPDGVDTGAGAAVGRPSARPRLQTAQATASVQLWWDIGLGSERLLARARVEPRSGPIFRLQCRIPKDWRVDRTELQPVGLLADWTLLDGGNSDSLLVIHLTEAIEVAQAVTVLATLSRPTPAPTGSQQTFDFPRLDFSPAYSQVSTLGLSVAEQLRIKSTPAGAYWLRSESILQEGRQLPSESEKPLWDSHALWGLAYFHGQPPVGQLVVEGLVPRFKAHSTCRVEWSHDQPRIGMRLDLEALAGSSQSFDIQFSAPVPPDWRWTGADGRPVSARQIPAWQSLCLPGQTGGWLECLNILAVTLDRMQTWRFTLPAPLTIRSMIEKSSAPVSEGPPWSIPLPVRLNGEPIVGEVELLGFGSGHDVLEKRGLREASDKAVSLEPAEVSRLIYAKGPISLGVAAPRMRAGGRESARVDDVTLTTTVDGSGPLHERLTFRLQPSGTGTFPLRLPAEARLVSVRVDGRWITAPSVRREGAGQVLELPMPVGPPDQVIEVEWECTSSAWRFWSRGESIAPRFPVPAPNFRHLWLLAPGLSPANPSRLQPVPGYADGAEFGGVERWLAARYGASRERTQLQHLIAEAEIQIQGLANDLGPVTLGTRVQHLVTELTKGQLGLVVDAAALRECGIGPGSLPGDVKQPSIGRRPRTGIALAASSLQPFGLELLSSGSTPLLTTTQASLVMGGDTDAPATRQAILQAVRSGRDASGRFENAVLWLTGTNNQGPTLPLLDDQARPSPGWSCWQALNEDAVSSSLVIIRRDSCRWIGSIMLATLALAAWRVRRRRQALIVLTCGGFLAQVVLGSILPSNLFWLIMGPSLGGLLVCLAGLILERDSGKTLLAATAQVPLLVLALAALFTLPGLAAAPTDFTVLLLPEESGKKVGVLAPVDLLDALQVLIARNQQPLDRAILLDADYKARTLDGMVDFEAEFVIYSPDQGTADFVLPLGGAELREAQCDLLPAFPMSAPTGQTGYLFRLRGAGRHILSLRFSAPVKILGSERDCSVSVPDTIAARLDFTAPGGSQRLQAVLARGMQQVTVEPDSVRLQADLGRISTLQIRWRAAQPKEDSPALEVKESYVWELQKAQRLLGVYRYQVLRAPTSTLFIDLPAEWEVRRVEAFRLRDWSILKGPLGSRLGLEFQSPLSTSVQVFVELLSRKPASAQAELSLPTPVGVASNGGTLAYHVGRHEAALTQSLGFTGIDVKSFISQWQSFGVEDPGSVERAFSFRRSTGVLLSMHLALRSPADIIANQEILWRVGPRQLSSETVVNLVGNGELMFVEFGLPTGLHLEEIAGADVHQWSVTHQRAQVWLRPGTVRTGITCRAWAANPRQPGEPWDIPVVKVLRASQVSTTMRLEAEPGWNVTAGKLVNLRASNGQAGVLSLTADQPQYGGAILLREAKAKRASASAEPPTVLAERAKPNARNVHLVLEEQAALLQIGGDWEHRGEYDFLAGAGQATLCPPGNSVVVAAYLDGQELTIENSACLTLAFDGELRRRHLRVHWRWPASHETPDQPDLSKPRLDHVTRLPGYQEDAGFWEVVTPVETSVQAVDQTAFAVSPSLRFLRRAAAALDVARFAAPKDKGLYRDADLQFQRDIDAASAWLAQGPTLQERPADVPDLETSLQQLESEHRTLMQETSGAETRRPAIAQARSVSSVTPAGSGVGREHLAALGDSAGVSSFWRAAGKEIRPKIIVEQPSRGRWRFLTQAVLVALLGGGLLVMVSPWTKETWRSAFRPELLALLGAIAGFLFASWLLSLVVLFVSLIWRLARVILAAKFKRELTSPTDLANAGKQPASAQA
jgi:hypothetical protein